ncbi:hypothetical protein P8452_05610 [Trifolium repens]|nr:hypothetical protein P8452_05610 [Trifolium repens]
MSEIVGCFNERAQKLLERHLASGFKKYILWFKGDFALETFTVNLTTPNGKSELKHYCNSSVSSKLIFGEDKELLSHPNLNFTSFVGGQENSVDTFYYLGIKSIMADGEVLKIQEETWHLSEEGSGGTIIDSGTTLTYFAEPTYEIIKEAFMKKIKGYEVVEGFSPLWF